MEPREIEKATFPIVRRGYDVQSVQDFLRSVAVQYRQSLAAAELASQAAMEAEQSAGSGSTPEVFGNIGASVAGILASAAQAAEEIKVGTEQEVEAIRRAAIADAEKLRAQARKELTAAEEAKAKAEEEVNAARDAIRTEAARLRRESEEKALRLEADARRTVGQIEGTLRNNVESILAEARNQYEHLRGLEQRCVERLASLETILRDAREASGLEPGGELFEGLRESVAEQLPSASSQPRSANSQPRKVRAPEPRPSKP